MTFVLCLLLSLSVEGVSGFAFASTRVVEFGDHEYFIENYNLAQSYSEAEKACSKNQAHLAIANTKQISEFLVQAIRNLSGKVVNLALKAFIRLFLMI